MKFKITEEQSAQRLDIFLAEKIPTQTRSQLKKQINDGLFVVNSKTTTPHYKLKLGDVIEIIKARKAELKDEITSEKKIKKNPAIKIITETEDYLVINKPAGLIVHGDHHIKETVLTDILIKKFPEIKKIGDDPTRPGIVHRLDKDVSGLMVVARSQKFFKKIKKQFQDRTTYKNYTALVYGNIAKDEFTIDFHIERSKSGHKMAARPANQEGKTAISEIKVIKRYINYTLVNVRIITGRTHQVRVHLAAYGTPIVGDNVYATHTTKEKNKKLKTERVYLVATELSFTDLNKERQSFKIELPSEFKGLLKQVK